MYYIMLPSNAITLCYYPILPPHAKVTFDVFTITTSPHDINPCYHLMISTHDVTHDINTCYHQMYNPMLSPHVIITCYHPMITSNICTSHYHPSYYHIML
jgi:hypothetical protein